MKETNPQDQLDLLLRLERMTEELNRRMSGHSQVLWRRYPLTFALVAFFGVAAVGEGVKGLLQQIGILHEPWQLLLAGIFILTVLGLVYKKLDN